MKLLRLLMAQSPGLLLLTVAAGAVSGLANAGLLSLVNAAIHGAGSWSRQALALGFATLCLVVPAARTLSTFLMIRLGQSAVHDLRIRLSRSLLAAPLARLEELAPHRLLVMLTDDLTALSDSLVTVPTILVNAFVVLGCIAYLAWLSPPMLFLLLGSLLLGGLSYQIPMLRSMRRLRRAREEEDNLYHHFQGLTQGSRELKQSYHRRRAFLDSLHASSYTLRGLNLSAMTILSAAASWGQVLFFVLIGTILFVQPSMQTMDQGTMTGYALVLLYMISPIHVILNSFPALGRANVAIGKVEKLGFPLQDIKVEPARDREPRRPAPWSHLELRGVTHAYPREGDENPFHLGPVDLELRGGELVFLVGGNGSGKTTLLKLLVGLYSPESGEIRVDGRKIESDDRQAYRERFAVIFYDFYLFEKLLGIERDGLDEQAHGYLLLLQLDRKVEVKEGRLSTLRLSQGQRKRLALLTAYLEDREVYVFDEWAADQDPLFKDIFYHQLLPELKARGKTVIVVSHDDRYFSVADRVIKMDQGRIAQDTEIERQPSRSSALPTTRGEWSEWR